MIRAGLLVSAAADLSDRVSRVPVITRWPVRVPFSITAAGDAPTEVETRMLLIERGDVNGTASR